MPLKRIGKKGSWIKVKDVDNETHWVHHSLVTRSVSCVVVKSTFTYLRTGPGKKYPKAEIQVADRYASYKKIDERTGWVQVENSQKRKYWIYAGNLWEPVRIQKISF